TLLDSWLQSGQSHQKGAQALEVLKDKKVFDLFYNFHKGLLAHRAGKTDEAAADLKQIVSKASRFSYYPLIAYADILKQQNKQEEAKTLLENALAESEDNHLLKQSLKLLPAKDKRLFQFPTTTEQGLAQALTDVGVIYAHESDL